MNVLAKIATDSEKIADEISRRFENVPDIYFRLNAFRDSYAMADRPDSDTIPCIPIGEGLDGFRRLFNSACETVGASEVRDAAEQVKLLTESYAAGKTRRFAVLLFN